MASILLEIKKCECGGDILVQYRIDHHDREWIEEFCEECDHSDVEPYFGDDDSYEVILMRHHCYWLER